MRKLSPSESLFRRFEHLSIKYASKLYNFEKLGIEKEDLIQEFRIKLYQCIIAYGKSVANYQKTGLKKPIPIQFYLKKSMVNHVNDFIAEIEHKQNKIFESTHLVDSFDYAEFDDNHSIIDFDEKTIIVNGFDFLEGLDSIERLVFVWFCKGVPMEKLKKTFGSVLNVENFLKNRRTYLAENRELFNPENTAEFFVKRYAEEV